MKTIMKKSALSLITLAVLGSTAYAKGCYNAQNIDVTWTSYKTLSKIGVGGNFSKVDFSTKHKEAKTINDMLVGAKIETGLADIDAHMDLKNNNIAEFFTAHVKNKAIQAEIISVSTKSIEVDITLNDTTIRIPMKYTIEDAKVKATGVIDGFDYGLLPALNSLNTNVSGHLNKGWTDIDIGFELPYTNTCK